LLIVERTSVIIPGVGLAWLGTLVWWEGGRV